MVVELVPVATAVAAAAGAGVDVTDLVLDGDRGRDALPESALRPWGMVYLVVMRVCKIRGGNGVRFFFGGVFSLAGRNCVGRGGGGKRTVVGRAERRRVEFCSQDCAVGRYGILCQVQRVPDEKTRLVRGGEGKMRVVEFRKALNAFLLFVV